MEAGLNDDDVVTVDVRGRQETFVITKPPFVHPTYGRPEYCLALRPPGIGVREAECKYQTSKMQSSRSCSAHWIRRRWMSLSSSATRYRTTRLRRLLVADLGLTGDVTAAEAHR